MVRSASLINGQQIALFNPKDGEKIVKKDPARIARDKAAAIASYNLYKSYSNPIMNCLTLMCLFVTLGSVVNGKIKLFEPFTMLPIGLSVIIGTSLSLKFDNEYKIHLLKKIHEFSH